ncbi:CCR4-NOT transcription complex subunit 3 isoform X2 [Macadamia integrifolia]|uniref:CCR4-NOT transcription complex subunit 3 isoform X2 n=1 Tax=Macadamia integrifolia TaxID=60698 RepID=UPI001C530CEB|nr:CCR4-NOT transcription complex subunit 3 isoform X2 [Macadamia integrifolia]
MGASRKLQGEIDRVLKKVQEGVDVFDSIWNKVYDTDNANQKEKFEADLKKEIKKLQRYRDQIKTWIQSSEIKDKKALLDARKQIEREMERFKVCEKETKTKAFSKEGLGQQPKTDPKEKAKSETRDWLNNVVGELETQVDHFEAEIEGLSVKKGKTRPPRLTHLETSIGRHKAHIMKLELILRLLDNDELNPEQVNDVRDFLEDYVERNQDDFEDFSDVDELYNTLPLDKVESLEDLVTIAPPGLVKGVGAAGAVLGLKTSLAGSTTQISAPLASTVQQGISIPDQVEETASQDSNSDTVPRTPPSKNSVVGSVSSTPTGNHSTAVSSTISAPVSSNVSARTLAVGSTASAILSGAGSVRGVLDNSVSAVPPSPVNLSGSVKEDENASFPGRRSSPSLAEIGLGRGIGRGSVAGVISSQPSNSVPLSSGSTIPGNGALGAVPTASDIAKRNILGADERIGSSGQPLVSPISNRILLPQVSKAEGTGSLDSNNVSDSTVIGGRVFSPSVVPGVQWRPGSSFQNQPEVGQFRGRTEIAPDQREKFLQRFNQVQQQSQLNVSHLAGGNHKQFSAQPQNSLLQQFNSQNSTLQSPVGMGLGVQSPGLNAVTSNSLQQPNSIHQQPTQHALNLPSPKDSDVSHVKIEDQQQQQQQQQQQSSSDDAMGEPVSSSGVNKNLLNEDDMKTSYSVDAAAGGSGSLIEPAQVHRDIDLSPGQPIQSNQPSVGLGVIGRRSVSDLGAIGDNLSGLIANSGGMHDHLYNLQMLEAAYYKLPQPKDSERPKSYIPRHPAVTPLSYPQVQAPIVSNPAFWERLGIDTLGTDTLFFAFYYQQNTYQQYMAARELKKQSWRFHRKYNTWFQRHEEPKVTTDEYEQGTYVYFDFHIANDDLQHGWCQRIKTEFTFEYSYLEDELGV